LWRDIWSLAQWQHKSWWFTKAQCTLGIYILLMSFGYLCGIVAVSVVEDMWCVGLSVYVILKGVYDCKMNSSCVLNTVRDGVIVLLYCVYSMLWCFVWCLHYCYFVVDMVCNHGGCVVVVIWVILVIWVMLVIWVITSIMGSSGNMGNTSYG